MTLLGLDTNVIVRTLVADDPQQMAVAKEFARGLGREYTAFVTLISLLELDWALRSRYGFKKKEVVLAIGKLLQTRGLVMKAMRLSLLRFGRLKIRTWISLMLSSPAARWKRDANPLKPSIRKPLRASPEWNFSHE